MKKEIPSINIKDNMLTISISADQLKDVAERNPNCGYKVSDKIQFLIDFSKTLKDSISSNARETGLTDLQYLFDEIIEDTCTTSDAITDEGFENNENFKP